jgi:transcription initiation factor TFIIH subunit 3
MAFLSVIIDANACNWGALVERHDNEAVKTVLASIVGLCNAHILGSLNNRLLLIAAGADKKDKVLFSSEMLSREPNTCAVMDKRIREALACSANSDGSSASSAFSAAISLSICSYNRFKKEMNRTLGRMALISLARDLSSEQNILMNLVFASQQQGLKVDAVSLNGSIPILQQACDIASGSYFEVTEPQQLVTILMNNILSNTHGTDALSSNESKKIDYRAACHCHQQLVDIGWVCTVCLAVHCKAVPFCTTCSTVFSSSQKKTRRRR